MNASNLNSNASLVMKRDCAPSATNSECCSGQGSDFRVTNPNNLATLMAPPVHDSQSSRQVSEYTRRFDELVAVHLDDLFRFAYWLSGDHAVAEDVVQEALVRAWKSIDRLNDRQAAKGWLLTIVRRENARHYGRTVQKQADIPADNLVDQRTDYDTSTEAFVLRRALNRLPPDYREPLLMQVVYGYSQKEIAAHLGISNAGAGTRLFRARQRMRELL